MKTKNNYKQYGKTEKQQLSTMFSTIEKLKYDLANKTQMEEQLREFTDAGMKRDNEMIKDLLQKMPIQVYREQIEETAFSSETEINEATRLKGILRKSKAIRKKFDIPSRQAWFSRTMNGSLCFVIKF